MLRLCRVMTRRARLLFVVCTRLCVRVCMCAQSIDAFPRQKEAIAMKEALLFGRIREMAQILQRGWEAKKATSDAVSTPLIEKLFADAIAAGAVAGKVRTVRRGQRREGSRAPTHLGVGCGWRRLYYVPRGAQAARRCHSRARGWRRIVAALPRANRRAKRRRLALLRRRRDSPPWVRLRGCHASKRRNEGSVNPSQTPSLVESVEGRLGLLPALGRRLQRECDANPRRIGEQRLC